MYKLNSTPQVTIPWTPHVLCTFQFILIFMYSLNNFCFNILEYNLKFLVAKLLIAIS